MVAIEAVGDDIPMGGRIEHGIHDELLVARTEFAKAHLAPLIASIKAVGSTGRHPGTQVLPGYQGPR